MPLAELVQLGAKVESTEGTFTAPGAGDMKLMVRSPTFKFMNPKAERELRSPTFDSYPHVGRAAGAEITFELDLYAQTNLAKPAWVDTLIKACAIATITGGSGSAWVLKPASSTALATVPSLSMTVNVDGYMRSLCGARGDVDVAMTVGQGLVAKFTFQGVYVAPSDTAFTGSITYDTNAHDLPCFVGASVALSAISPATNGLSTSECILERCELQMGNRLTLRPSANSSMGYASCQIVGRAPKIVIDPEWVSVAAHDFLEAMRLDYRYGFTTGALAGHTAGNNIAIAAPNVQYAGINEQNKNGRLVAQVDLACRGTSGDDDVSITLSA